MGDLVPCEHQVAGWHGGSLSCVLKNKKGQILKPVKLNANPTYDKSSLCHSVKENGAKDGNVEDLLPVCRDEQAFYELVTASTKLDDVALNLLMPKYCGCQQITKEDGQVIPHLVLEDLAHELRLPCIMDIKIGLSQEYPSKTKNDRPNKTKYATQDSLGFCLTGVRVFNPNTSQLTIDLRPDGCKQLTSNEVHNALEVFCQKSSSSVSKPLQEAVVEGLMKIRKWILEQRSYKIRAGSVLILYDASQTSDILPVSLTSPNIDAGTNLHEQPQKLKVIVKMIDFAHVFHACGEQDNNYLIGLDNLIDIYRNNK